jgi:hypothetical protein
MAEGNAGCYDCLAANLSLKAYAGIAATGACFPA